MRRSIRTQPTTARAVEPAKTKAPSTSFAASNGTPHRAMPERSQRGVADPLPIVSSLEPSAHRHRLGCGRIPLQTGRTRHQRLRAKDWRHPEVCLLPGSHVGRPLGQPAQQPKRGGLKAAYARAEPLPELMAKPPGGTRGPAQTHRFESLASDPAAGRSTPKPMPKAFRSHTRCARTLPLRHQTRQAEHLRVDCSRFHMPGVAHTSLTPAETAACALSAASIGSAHAPNRCKAFRSAAHRLASLPYACSQGVSDRENWGSASR